MNHNYFGLSMLYPCPIKQFLAALSWKPLIVTETPLAEILIPPGTTYRCPYIASTVDILLLPLGIFVFLGRNSNPILIVGVYPKGNTWSTGHTNPIRLVGFLPADWRNKLNYQHCYLLLFPKNYSYYSTKD